MVRTAICHAGGPGSIPVETQAIFKRSQSDALQEKAFVVDVVVHVHTHLL